MSFSWNQLPKPIFGLAPMDGVTDAVFRSIVYRSGAPDVLFTEFVSVEGLSRKIPALLRDLQYQPEERPMIAQIYGYEPEAFKQSIKIVADLGFDGVDINMGCPAKSVVHSGGGAALIRTCPHAKTIIYTCASALDEYYEQTGKRLPLSVKTRLGYDKIVVKDWIRELLDTEKLSNISLHGRTLKQAYTGNADWDAIAQAAELTRGTNVTLLGNGDLNSLEDAAHKIRISGVDGALLGRASFGNPWLFREKENYRIQTSPSLPPSSLEGESGRRTDEGVISIQDRISTLIEHARLLWKSKEPRHFIQIRKHAGWYLKGFPGAAELRNSLVRVSSLDELEAILINHLQKAA